MHLVYINIKLINVKILVSGGQGPDEPISEALAMQRYLIQHGFPNLVLLWNLNLQIRLKTSIIQKVIHNLYSNSPNILCVTSQFHILRGMKFTHTNRMKVDGMEVTLLIISLMSH